MKTTGDVKYPRSWGSTEFLWEIGCSHRNSRFLLGRYRAVTCFGGFIVYSQRSCRPSTRKVVQRDPGQD
ncbi:epoxide hydrolase 1 [Moniliophthora roreri]|nr:epoxide hydrolase 1 [Moniliophthora roreri]